MGSKIVRISVLLILLASGSFACGKIEGPDFPYYDSPRVVVQIPSSPASWIVAIHFNIIDRENEPASIVVEFSINGSSFSACALTNSSLTTGLDSGLYAGERHIVYWDSLADMAGQSGDDVVTIRITASDASNPSGGTPGEATFTVNNLGCNTPPAASVTTPSGEQNGNVRIDYSLFDNESHLCGIVVHYSMNNGAGWSMATMGAAGDGLTSLTSSPAGTAHMLYWDSRADSVALIAANTNVKIRITPSDFNEGAASETAGFTVDNTYANNPPTVEITSGPDNGSTVTTSSVTFEWIGTDNDGTISGYYYSMDHDPPDVWTTGTSRIFDDLSNGEHVFRVVAMDNVSDFSDVAARSFVTAATSLTAPTNPKPENGATDVAVYTDFEWSDVASAKQYYLFTGLSADNLVFTGDVFKNSTFISKMAPGTTYYWQVVATDYLENATSEIWHFQTAPLFRMTWTDITSTPCPSGRSVTAMAWNGSCIVLFGGGKKTSTSVLISETTAVTWIWDGNDWASITTGTMPLPRLGHSMCYDGQGALLFGGVSYDGSEFKHSNDMWRYSAGNWVELTPSGAPPECRIYHDMAYDSNRNVVVVFGGMTPSSTPLGDTWEYDIAANSWTEIFPSFSPNERAFHGLAYVGNSIVLYGGMDPVYAYADTVLWNYSTPAWERQTRGPFPDISFNCVFKTNTDKDYALLQGGITIVTFIRCNNAYRWINGSWNGIEYTNPGTAPSPRELHAMAYDRAHKEFVIFGGYDGSTNFDETYVLKEAE